MNFHERLDRLTNLFIKRYCLGFPTKNASFPKKVLKTDRHLTFLPMNLTKFGLNILHQCLSSLLFMPPHLHDTCVCVGGGYGVLVVHTRVRVYVVTRASQ